jgi:hypothetical protein
MTLHDAQCTQLGHIYWENVTSVANDIIGFNIEQPLPLPFLTLFMATHAHGRGNTSSFHPDYHTPIQSLTTNGNDLSQDRPCTDDWVCPPIAYTNRVIFKISRWQARVERRDVVLPRCPWYYESTSGHNKQKLSHPLTRCRLKHKPPAGVMELWLAN